MDFEVCFRLGLVSIVLLKSVFIRVHPWFQLRIGSGTTILLNSHAFASFVKNK
jgi:hypothetical protein